MNGNKHNSLKRYSSLTYKDIDLKEWLLLISNPDKEEKVSSDKILLFSLIEIQLYLFYFVYLLYSICSWKRKFSKAFLTTYEAQYGQY